MKITSDTFSPVPALLQRSLWQQRQNNVAMENVSMWEDSPDEYIDIRNISIHYIDIDKLIFVIFEFSPVLVT